MSEAVGAATLVGSSQDSPVGGIEDEFGTVSVDSDSSDATYSSSSDRSDSADTSDSDEEVQSSVSYEDVIETRDALVAAIDAELENPLTTDTMFTLLLQTRSTVYLMLTEVAEGQSELMTVTLPEVMPAVVVAYNYYDDANRNLEITSRNSVANAGFCPVELRLLSK